jgi:hypothetical protein
MKVVVSVANSVIFVDFTMITLSSLSEVNAEFGHIMYTEIYMGLRNKHFIE